RGLVHESIRWHRRRRSGHLGLCVVAARSLGRSKAVAIDGVGTDRRAHRASVRAALTRRNASHGTRARASPPRAVDACAVSGRRMSAVAALSRFFGRTRERSPRPDALSPIQVRWLGALLVAAMLPQAAHLPLGIAVLGLILIALRLAATWRPHVRPVALLAELPSWGLALFALAVALAIRKWYGYFLGREPSVAFLFVLCGIKFMEARARRDGTLAVCLATFLLITPFLSNQSMFAVIAAVPALVLLGGALDALERSPATLPRDRSAPLKRTL